MSTYTLTDLYEEYIEARKIKLTYEQFSAFTTYYPALLVAKTDGEVDEREWSLLQSLAEHLVAETVASDADAEEIKDYKQLFFNEFQYLIDNLDRWDRKFMRVLQQMLAKHPELVDAVTAVIYSLAEASKGICEKENVMIEYLRNELKVKDFCINISVNNKAAATQTEMRQPKWHTFLTTFWVSL